MPSGRWGWTQELIGSLGFDAEQRWQVGVARPSEPRLHIYCVAGHCGNCHSSLSRRDKKMCFFIYIELFCVSVSYWKLKNPQSLFTCFPSYRMKWWSVQPCAGIWFMMSMNCSHEKRELWPCQSQLLSGGVGGKRLHGSMTLGWLSVALALIVAQGNYCSWVAGHSGPQEGYSDPLKPVVARRSHKNDTS